MTPVINLSPVTMAVSIIAGNNDTGDKACNNNISNNLSLVSATTAMKHLQQNNQLAYTSKCTLSKKIITYMNVNTKQQPNSISTIYEKTSFLKTVRECH
jgi:hypothetical protein